MGGGERTRERVEDLLSELERTYEGFPVRQTTVTVPADCYEGVRDRCRRAVGRVDVHVWNDADEVLLVENDEGTTVPSSRLSAQGSVGTAARRAVAAETGVECQVRCIEEVTIVGVHDGDRDRGALYRLVALLSGDHTGGTPGEGCRWDGEPPPSELLI